VTQKTCPVCSAQNDQEAAFCRECGASLGEAAASGDANAYQPPGNYQAPPANQGYQPAGSSWSDGQGGGAPLPEGYVPAGFWVRFGAYLIDGVILWVIQLVLLAIGLGALSYVVSIAYFVVFWALKGQTPGKMALGLHVVTATGEPLDWGKAIIRYVGYIVSGIILGSGFLMIAFDDSKRGFHDRIAGTLVVKKTF